MSDGLIPSNGDGALAGVRVLDFTWVHAGPSGTRVLADQGAEVIKVESGLALPVVGGPTARTARGVGARENWNADKRSIALNMKNHRAVEIAKRLAAVSDVVTENFSGRVMVGWGMDYDSLRRVNPNIIMLSMSGFGRTGPWKQRVSYGQTLQAGSGFTDLTGFPWTDPSGPASAYSDAVAGMAGAQAVLLALIHRTRTGEGQLIDLSQFEALSSLLESLVLDLSVNGSNREVLRAGNRQIYGSNAPHGVYRCKGQDRWVAIAVDTDDQWRAVVAAMESPDWTAEERFGSADRRLRHSDDLDTLMEAWTEQNTAEALMHRLQGVGVAAGVVQMGADLSVDPHLRERGFFRRVPNAEGVSRTIEGAPYKLSRTPGGPVRGAPEFGGDQTYVLRDLLGMSDDELGDCAIEGVFE